MNTKKKKNFFSDQYFLSNSENEANFVTSTPENTDNAWIDSLRTDGDSGCHDDGSASSISPDEPQDYLTKLGKLFVAVFPF